MKEKNIQELAIRMGLITVEDMCQYTIAQLVYMVANKVNELVDEVWRFETNVQETLKTQNENIQYLLGEGLLLEVENIFNGWVQDGTFDTLINQTALKKVNGRIDETNAQLLNYVKKGYGTLSDFDEETRRAIQGIESTNINAVLGFENVQTENINNHSITCSKLSESIQTRMGKLQVTYKEVGHNIGFVNTMGKIENLGNYHYKILDVVPSQLLYVSANCKGSNGALAIFETKDGDFISSYKKVSETGAMKYTDELLEIPENCYKVKLCSSIDTSVIVKEKEVVDIVSIADSLQAKVLEEVYKEIGYGVGNVNSMGEIQTQYNDYSYKKIPVQGDEVLYVTTNCVSSSGSLAVFLDKNSAYISSYKKVSETGPVKYVDEEITIPSNCSFILICTKFVDENPIIIKSEVNKSFTYKEFINFKEEVATNENFSSYKELMFENKQLEERLEEAEKLIEFDWKKFDKGYVVFIIDDGRHDLCQFSEIFKEYNVPLSCALMSNGLLSSTQDDGRKLIDVALEIQTNGGEILSHSTTGAVFTEDTTEEVANERFRTSKKVLSDNGLIINGFVKPGGNGALNRLDKFEHLARKFYRYGYSVGSSNQFKLSRYTIGNDFSIHQNKLVNCINNKSLLVFYGHSFDSDEVGESTLRSIIEFVRDNEGIEIVTTKYLYDNFATTTLDNRLKALENKLGTNG